MIFEPLHRSAEVVGPRFHARLPPKSRAESVPTSSHCSAPGRGATAGPHDFPDRRWTSMIFRGSETFGKSAHVSAGSPRCEQEEDSQQNDDGLVAVPSRTRRRACARSPRIGVNRSARRMDGTAEVRCGCGTTYPTCPEREDGWLVERSDSYGKFLGCVRYPTCVGKAKIMSGDRSAVTTPRRRNRA